MIAEKLVNRTPQANLQSHSAVTLTRQINIKPLLTTSLNFPIVIHESHSNLSCNGDHQDGDKIFLLTKIEKQLVLYFIFVTPASNFYYGFYYVLGIFT